MKLHIPETVISEDEGFSEAKDIFQRKEFGERLANLIASSTEGLVLALDAKWGEGKSTFIKMWRGYVAFQHEAKMTTIYFDAFANDYQKDPFLSLAAELYDLIKSEPEEKRTNFRRKAVNAMKSHGARRYQDRRKHRIRRCDSGDSVGLRRKGHLKFASRTS